MVDGFYPNLTQPFIHYGCCECCYPPNHLWSFQYKCVTQGNFGKEENSYLKQFNSQGNPFITKFKNAMRSSLGRDNI